MKKLISLVLIIAALPAFGGSSYETGKITSLLASATDPAIRLEGNKSPTLCDAGQYGWIRFQGTPEERNRIYGSALALSLAGKLVTVYTNSDNGVCRINNIQVTSGLN